jgi:SAM-dependent methyltransferase
LWYPLLTRQLHGEEVLFLNYAYEEEPPMGIPLSPEDEMNRACIQLYHHVASQAPLRGKNILEVSCGHGGGAAYLTRALQPQRYTALDLNPAGIRFCKQRHQVAGLVFIQGDAENLPFAPSTFDGVRGMNQNSSRSLDLVERRLPRFLHSLGRDFAGTKGSRIYKALHSGELSYRSYCFEKPVINTTLPI